MSPFVIAFVLAADGASPPQAERGQNKDAGAPPAGVPACLTVTTESRYVPYGYNHLVTLKSACPKPLTCMVSTDVNPEKQKVEVAPNATVEVTTFLGAATQTFTARVSCTNSGK